MRHPEFSNLDQETIERESPFQDGKLRETLLWYLDKNTNLARQENLYDLHHPEGTYSLNQLIDKVQNDPELLKEINHFLKLLIGKAKQGESHTRQDMVDINALYQLLNPTAGELILSDEEIEEALNSIEALSFQSFPKPKGAKDIDEEDLRSRF